MPVPRVLVIEDAASTRLLVELSLTTDGYEVSARDDGPSGLEAALAENPDLIVLDIALPGMDGWEILRRIRAEPTRQHIPVVVITAHDIAQFDSACVSENADGFVSKPFDIAELRSEVTRLINGRTPAV